MVHNVSVLILQWCVQLSRGLYFHPMKNYWSTVLPSSYYINTIGTTMVYMTTPSPRQLNDDPLLFSSRVSFCLMKVLYTYYFSTLVLSNLQLVAISCEIWKPYYAFLLQYLMKQKTQEYFALEASNLVGKKLLMSRLSLPIFRSECQGQGLFSFFFRFWGHKCFTNISCYNCTLNKNMFVKFIPSFPTYENRLDI